MVFRTIPKRYVFRMMWQKVLYFQFLFKTRNEFNFFPNNKIYNFRVYCRDTNSSKNLVLRDSAYKADNEL
jgi:hypothetical protein